MRRISEQAARPAIEHADGAVILVKGSYVIIRQVADILREKGTNR